MSYALHLTGGGLSRLGLNGTTLPGSQIFKKYEHRGVRVALILSYSSKLSAKMQWNEQSAEVGGITNSNTISY